MKALIGRHFQPGEGPIRGLLRDCENSADLHFKLYQGVVPGRAGRHHVRAHPGDVPGVDGSLQLHHPPLYVRVARATEVPRQPAVPVGPPAVRCCQADM